MPVSPVVTEIEIFVSRVTQHFQSCLGNSLVDAYKLGSLAHGGFSNVYSDIDVGLLLNCTEPPDEMADLITRAKSLDPEYGKKLSVFWGNAEFTWGRLPVIDRIDLLDHGVPLLHGVKPTFRRPTSEEIRQEQLQSIERSWKSRLPELSRLITLDAKDRKPYIRAVEYLHEVQPSGLDLEPINLALACRNEKCTAEDVFALRTDLERQCESAVSYISRAPTLTPR